MHYVATDLGADIRGLADFTLLKVGLMKAIHTNR